jgi:hypothetical protein
MLPFRPLVVVAQRSRAATPGPVLAHKCGDTVFAKASVPMVAAWAAVPQAVARGAGGGGTPVTATSRAGPPSL